RPWPPAPETAKTQDLEAINRHRVEVIHFPESSRCIGGSPGGCRRSRNPARGSPKLFKGREKYKRSSLKCIGAPSRHFRRPWREVGGASIHVYESSRCIDGPSTPLGAGGREFLVGVEEFFGGRIHGDERFWCISLGGI